MSLAPCPYYIKAVLEYGKFALHDMWEIIENLYFRILFRIENWNDYQRGDRQIFSKSAIFQSSSTAEVGSKIIFPWSASKHGSFIVIAVRAYHAALGSG